MWFFWTLLTFVVHFVIIFSTEGEAMSKSFRIDEYTPVHIFYDIALGIDEEIKNTEKMLRSKDYKFHAAALCLYSCLLCDGLSDDLIKRINPNYSARLGMARKQFAGDPKYSGLSYDEKEKLIRDICLQDVRNCFSHGLFEILPGSNVANSSFILMPNQSKIYGDGKILVSFGAVHDAMGEMHQKLAFEHLHSHGVDMGLLKIANAVGLTSSVLPKNKVVGSLSKEEQVGLISKISIPAYLLELSDYYAFGSSRLKNGSVPNVAYDFLENIFLSAMFSYNQNDFYQIFGAKTEVFDGVSLIRNSIIHHNTTLTDFSTQKIEDSYKGKSRSYESDIESINLKMTVLETARIAAKRCNLNIELPSNFIESNATIDELLGILDSMNKAIDDAVQDLLNQKK